MIISYYINMIISYYIHFILIFLVFYFVLFVTGDGTKFWGLFYLIYGLKLCSYELIYTR